MKGIKLKTRINLTIAVVLVAIFTTLGITLFNVIKNDIEAETNQRMKDHVQDLHTILDDHTKLKQEQINIAMSLASEMFKGMGKLTESSSTMEVRAVDQVSKNESVYSIHQWNINNQSLYNNHQFVDMVKSYSVDAVTVFQKIDAGYLRISTNVLNKDGSRAVNTFIPNSSEVVQQIDFGKKYYGRAFVVDDWYLTAYEPIWIDGEVKGMLFVGVKEKNYDMIKKIFSDKKYYTSGYPFLVTDSGELIIHPNMEGENIFNTKFFQQLEKSKESDFKSEYRWPETEDGKLKTQYFKYFAPYKCYISTSIYNDDLYARISKMMNIVLIGVIVTIIVFFAIFSYVLNPVINEITRMADMAKGIADGDLTIHIESKRRDEIGILALALQQMTSKLKDIVGNLVVSIQTLSQASEELNSAAQRVSVGSSEQAASAEEVQRQWRRCRQGYIKMPKMH